MKKHTHVGSRIRAEQRVILISLVNKKTGANMSDARTGIVFLNTSGKGNVPRNKGKGKLASGWPYLKGTNAILVWHS